jgi:hypothetical protein
MRISLVAFLDSERLRTVFVKRTSFVISPQYSTSVIDVIEKAVDILQESS